MVEESAPEAEYAMARLAELTEVEPRLAAVVDAVSALASRRGSAEHIAAVRRLPELVVRAAQGVEELIAYASQLCADLVGEPQPGDESQTASSTAAARRLVRDVFAVEDVRIVLARGRSAGYRTSVAAAPDDLTRDADDLGQALENALTDYTSALRALAGALTPATTATTAVTALPCRSRDVTRHGTGRPGRLRDGPARP